VLDVLMLLLVFASFAGAAGYISACEAAIRDPAHPRQPG